jgi:hypothetical protein
MKQKELRQLKEEEYNEIERIQNYTLPSAIKCGHNPEDYKQDYDAFVIGHNYKSPDRDNPKWFDLAGRGPSDVLARHKTCIKCGAKIRFLIDAYNGNPLETLLNNPTNK